MLHHRENFAHSSRDLSFDVRRYQTAELSGSDEKPRADGRLVFGLGKLTMSVVLCLTVSPPTDSSIGSVNQLAAL